jgi:UDP-glucose 4-epimerase
VSPPTGMTRLGDEGAVVVTGGAGAIGSVLVQGLLADGAEVRVVDNLSSGNRALLPSAGSAPRLSFHAFDLARGELPSDVVAGASAIWHLAANPDIRKGTADPRVDLDNGTLATFHVLESARKADLPRVRFSSSSVVYGLASVQPTPETYGPLAPESLYGAAKLASEAMLSAYAHSYGLTAHIFRFANIIDGRMNHGILYDFFQKLRRDPHRLEVLGDGRQAKSYLRTEDCVRGMRLAADRATERVNFFNLGAADRITVREIAEKVVRAFGGSARIDYTGGSKGWTGDVPFQLLSIEKLRALGWSPATGSAGAVDRTIAELLATVPTPP